ncbi:hypothetical protein, partial [Phreatobacter sp. AB_2022a]|uniref:hypothetical protein n=1 Tax=Phreatobacter sp. AB_2022a TaxID=3003134 RepID=UPI0022874506
MTRNEVRSRPAQARGGDGGSTPFADALEAGEQEAPQRARPVRAPAAKRPSQVPETETAQPNAAPPAAPIDRREPVSAASEGGPKKTET